MKKLSEIISVGKLVGSRGNEFRKSTTSKPDDWRDRIGHDVGALRNAAHERAAVDKADAARKEREAKVEKRTKEAEQRAKETLKMTKESAEAPGTAARVKIRNVARPDDAPPTSEKSPLARNGEIKVKKVDEEIASAISRKYGLSDSVLEAARAVMEKKTEVDLDPETNDKFNDDDDDDVKKESKHTTPKSDKEKKLAALAHPKDKITHKDVLVGRGVLKKEETEIEEAKVTHGVGAAAIRAIAGKPAGDKDVGKAKWKELDSKEKALKNHPEAGTGKFAKELNKLTKAKTSVATKHGLNAFGEGVDVDSLTEEQLEEVLKKSQPAGEWIKDFVHSKDPKFAGKSKKERMRMALGAYYAKQRNEEIEEVDEAIKPYVSYTAGGMGKSPSATVMAANEKPHKTFSKAEHGADYKQKALDYFKKHGKRIKEEIQVDVEYENNEIDLQEISKKLAKNYLDKINKEREENKGKYSTPAKFYGRGRGASIADAKLKGRVLKANDNTRHRAERIKIPATKEEVELTYEEIERIEAIAAQLDEAKPTVVSAPIRGANQDQSGFSVKKSVADYTISDSKKVKMKEEVELDEASPMAAPPKNRYDSADEAKAAAKKAREAGKNVKILKHTFTHPRTGEQTHSYSVKEEAELDEARGRPKKSGEAAEGDDTHKHPIQQLNKIAASMQGNEPHFEHKDGSKTKISKQVAKHVSSIYGGLRTSQEKDDFAKGLHASRESFKSTVSKHAR